MPPRFSFNTDLASSVNALSNQTWFKHFCGWWTDHLPHKIGGKKTFAFVRTKIIHLKKNSFKNWRQKRT
jgi:hypothetical protein